MDLRIERFANRKHPKDMIAEERIAETRFLLSEISCSIPIAMAGIRFCELTGHQYMRLSEIRDSELIECARNRVCEDLILMPIEELKRNITPPREASPVAAGMPEWLSALI